PPPTLEFMPEDMLNAPPATTDAVADARLDTPPPTIAPNPDAELPDPPTTEEKSAVAELESPGLWDPPPDMTEFAPRARLLIPPATDAGPVTQFGPNMESD